MVIDKQLQITPNKVLNHLLQVFVGFETLPKNLKLIMVIDKQLQITPNKVLNHLFSGPNFSFFGECFRVF